MTTLTAQELRDIDPSQFEREYYAWREYEPYDDWYCFLEEEFKTTCRPMGINVDRIWFTGFYCQGDGAGFTGDVSLWVYMKHMGLDAQYPALYQAIVDDGSYVQVTYGNHNNMSFDVHEGLSYIDPAGLFAELDHDTWSALVDSDWADAQLEQGVRELCADVCSDLFNKLEEEYEYLTSEAQFIESCDCNDIEFEYQGDEE